MILISMLNRLGAFVLSLGITTLFALTWVAPALATSNAGPQPGSIAQPTNAEESQDHAKQPTTEPADGAQLTRPARSLRVWFDHAPNVAKSSLSLEGPKGSLSIEGLHSMGDNDLMARVVGAMPDGEYTAAWSTEDEAGNKKKGSWTFTIQRSPPKQLIGGRTLGTFP